MCDEATRAEDEEFIRLNRRDFASMVGGAGLAGLIPGAALAAASSHHDMVKRDLVVKTPDGMADCFFVHPAKGKYPGVILWPDVFGLRATKKAMAERLAHAGYAVLAVNPYYRSVKAPVIPEGEPLRSDANWPKVRAQAARLTPATNATDAKAFVAFLDKQKAVDRKKRVGTMGYCMGGPMVMRTAAAVPDRIGAVASFHGSSLANDKPESTHLLIPQTKASYLIAIAQNDDARSPAEKDILKSAFAAAGRPAEIEVYPANHGWCPPDGSVYDKEQAERAWGRMLNLFNTALKG
jgi:carboxymethylenebutenolidase